MFYEARLTFQFHFTTLSLCRYVTGVQAGQRASVAAVDLAVCLQRRGVRLSGQRHHHPPHGARHHQVSVDIGLELPLGLNIIGWTLI